MRTAIAGFEKGSTTTEMGAGEHIRSMMPTLERPTCQQFLADGSNKKKLQCNEEATR